MTNFNTIYNAIGPTKYAIKVTAPELPIDPQDDTSYSEADTVFYGVFTRAIEATQNIQASP